MTGCSLFLLVVLATACGDDTGDGNVADASNAPPDVDVASCGAIGMACGGGCPGDLECLDGVCAPMRGSCGGFTGEPCQDTALTCVYPSGSTAGICMRPDEKACVCALAPSKLSDCMPP